MSNSSGAIASGRLEINYNGQWGTMCVDNFDQNEASVACRMLGFDDRFLLLFIQRKIAKKNKAKQQINKTKTNIM